MLTTGMMWLDNDPKTTLDAKVRRAAEYYRQKYGATPNACLVNPRTLSEAETRVGTITVRAKRYILPGNLWIGIENA